MAMTDKRYSNRRRCRKN